MVEILTPEQILVLADQIKELLAKDSQGVGEVSVVASLDNILSLPALQIIGSDEKVVEAPLSLLRVSLRKAATAIEWRQGDTGAWQTLISIPDITGPKGETPVFRTGENGIEWKYESEQDVAYRVLVSYDVLKLKFSDLTTEQIQLLKLKYSDLNEEEISALQQPAVDAAARADEKMIQLSAEVNQTREKLVTDAGKVNTDLTTAVGALEERAGTVISETNTAKVATETATANATKATSDALAAAELAVSAVTDTETATDLAAAAAVLAGEKAALANTAAGSANTAAGLAADAAALADEKAALATTAAGVADTATSKANTASTNADTATKRANDAAAAAENIVSGVRPDWAVDDPISGNYIANKPDIPDWALEPEAPDSFPEAPANGKTYGRKDGAWSEVNSAGNMDGGTAFSVYGGSLVMNGGNAND